jgi:hypothetical protein
MRITIIAVVLTTCATAHAQSANPLTAGATFHYGIIKGYVTRTASKIPETDTKADLTKALAESFAYCDKQYSAMTDALGTPIVKFDAGGEGSREPVQMPRLGRKATGRL